VILTKTIPLTNGREALVDDDDYEYLNQFKWMFVNGYAARIDGTTGKMVYMHHDVLRLNRERNSINKRKSSAR
jgi:hypothetical protein